MAAAKSPAKKKLTQAEEALKKEIIGKVGRHFGKVQKSSIIFHLNFLWADFYVQISSILCRQRNTGMCLKI